MYDSNYYKTMNYADYLERGERYKKTAFELVDLLKKLGFLVDSSSFILDYGCAVGFLLEGFRMLGVQGVGYEISEWAIEEGKKRGNNINPTSELFSKPLGIFPEVGIALDVFEHMSDEDIKKVFKFAHPKIWVVRIPSSTDGGKTFHLPVSRTDPTHINCKTKLDWQTFFYDLGAKAQLPLNLYTIYDSPGVTCLLILM